jgi:hypothetical protein
MADRLVEPTVRIAHLVRAIEFCNREIGPLAATSTLRRGYIPLVSSGAAPAIKAPIQDAVWDAFIAVVRLPPKAA